MTSTIFSNDGISSPKEKRDKKREREPERAREPEIFPSVDSLPQVPSTARNGIGMWVAGIQLLKP